MFSKITYLNILFALLISILLFLILSAHPSSALIIWLWILSSITAAPIAYILNIDTDVFFSIASLNLLIILFLFSYLIITIATIGFRPQKTNSSRVKISSKSDTISSSWHKINPLNKVLILIIVCLISMTLLHIFWYFTGLSKFVIHYLPIPCLGYCP